MLARQIENKAKEALNALLVPQNTVQLDYSLFFLEREPPSLYIRPQVVCPSQTTALSTSLKPYMQLEL